MDTIPRFQDLVFWEPVKVSAFVPAFPSNSSISVEASAVNMKAGINREGIGFMFWGLAESKGMDCQAVIIYIDLNRAFPHVGIEVFLTVRNTSFTVRLKYLVTRFYFLQKNIRQLLKVLTTP